MEEIKFYIFDMNGTLTNTPFVDKSPLAVLSGRKEKLAELKAGGAQLAIASNQGGVAFGFQTEEDAKAEVQGIMEQLDIDYFRVAFGHPKPKWGYEEYASEWHLHQRKPAPGMLNDLMIQANATTEETMMIGDRDEDRDAAEAAEIRFAWTKDFFASEDENLKAI